MQNVQKSTLLLRVDNFATDNGKKACYASKVTEFFVYKKV